MILNRRNTQHIVFQAKEPEHRGKTRWTAGSSPGLHLHQSLNSTTTVPWPSPVFLNNLKFNELVREPNYLWTVTPQCDTSAQRKDEEDCWLLAAFFLSRVWRAITSVDDLCYWYLDFCVDPLFHNPDKKYSVVLCYCGLWLLCGKIWNPCQPVCDMCKYQFCGHQFLCSCFCCSLS